MSEPTAQVRRGYLDLADGQLHYLYRAGDGTPILFLHQTASSSEMWRAVMERLAVTNPLWALDTPGFGASFTPTGAPTMSNYVRWLAESADSIGGETIHFVGHHTGASIALDFAAAYPERVASLTLIGAAALSEEERQTFAGKLGAPFRPGRSGAYLLQNWEYLRVGGAGAQTRLLHREMIDMLRGWESRPHAYGAVWAQDTGALLDHVAAPLHLVTSRDDLLFSHFERTCALRPDARVTVLGGGANFAPDLVPDEMADALAASGFFAQPTC